DHEGSREERPDRKARKRSGRRAEILVDLLEDSRRLDDRFAGHRNDRRKPYVPLTAWTADGKGGEARNADRNGIGNLRQRSSVERKPVRGAVAKGGARYPRKLLLCILPLCPNDLSRSIKGQIDRPVAEALLSDVALEIGRRRAHTNSCELRIGWSEINGIEDTCRALNNAGVQQMSEGFDQRMNVVALRHHHIAR